MIALQINLKGLEKLTLKSLLHSSFFRFGIGAIWVLSAVTGLGIILNYESSPGRANPAPALWPADSTIQRQARKPELLMFVHPRCPCSRASIGELNSIMASCRERADVHVLFIKPTGFTDEWLRSDLWKSALSIPGVKVIQDNEGVETQKFHATVSGQTLLYNGEGRLLFNGGITSSRGHYGDNIGRSSILSLLLTGRSNHNQTFAFGCSLFAPANSLNQNQVREAAEK